MGGLLDTTNDNRKNSYGVLKEEKFQFFFFFYLLLLPYTVSPSCHRQSFKSHLSNIYIYANRFYANSLIWKNDLLLCSQRENMKGADLFCWIFTACFHKQMASLCRCGTVLFSGASLWRFSFWSCAWLWIPPPPSFLLVMELSAVCEDRVVTDMPLSSTDDLKMSAMLKLTLMSRRVQRTLVTHSDFGFTTTNYSFLSFS